MKGKGKTEYHDLASDQTDPALFSLQKSTIRTHAEKFFGFLKKTFRKRWKIGPLRTGILMTGDMRCVWRKADTYAGKEKTIYDGEQDSG